MHYPQLPMYALVRSVAYDEATDNLDIASGIPFSFMDVGGTPVFPLFTTQRRADAFAKNTNRTDRAVPCNAKRLLIIIGQFQDTKAIAIDPAGRTGEKPRVFQIQSIIDWLLRELPRTHSD